MDFAPVLDVNNNPTNPVIGTRSFGADPARVTEHGAAAMRSYKDVGVVPVGKHFPGHGDPSVDSHLDLPVQPAARERLDAVELLPFRAAIAAGIPALMTTHILFPALDPERPATLSRRNLTGLLRDPMVNDAGLLPLPSEPRVAVTGPPEAAAALVQLLHARGIVRARAGEEPGAEREIWLVERSAVLEPGTLPPHPGRIVVALREPYVLAQFADAGCRLAAYGSRPCALVALADALTGRAPATGRLPVTLAEEG